MGDISEYRGIVLVAGFIAGFVLLSSLVYSSFVVALPSDRQLEAPAYVDVSQILVYNYTDMFTFNLTNAGVQTGTGIQDFGGWFIQEWWITERGEQLTVLSKYANWGPFYWWWSDGTWFDFDYVQVTSPDWFYLYQPFRKINSGQALTGAKLDADYLTFSQLKYKVNFGDHEQDVWFFFNETKYSSPSDAWAGSELTVVWGITWDQTKTTYNAWEIIGMVLFFQKPSGLDTISTLLIYTPVFIGFGYIAFILILRMIGALFGGGA